MILLRNQTLFQQNELFNELRGSYVFVYKVNNESTQVMVIDRGLNGTSRLGETVGISRALLTSYYFHVYAPATGGLTACKHCKIASHLYHLTWPLESAVPQVARIRDAARDRVMAHVMKMEGKEDHILCETCLVQYGLDCLLHGHR